MYINLIDSEKQPKTLQVLVLRIKIPFATLHKGVYNREILLNGFCQTLSLPLQAGKGRREV